MKTAALLSEFPAIPTDEWEHAIRETVAGPEYAAKLIWHPEEGLAVKPYYRAEDIAGLQFLAAAPGEFPFVRGASSVGDWRIREQVDFDGVEDANRAAREAVAAGAEEIEFRRARIASSSEFVLLLASLEGIPVHMESLSQDSSRIVAERLREVPREAVVSADFDPLADLDFSAELLRIAPPGFKPFVIHADYFHEHAAVSIEEVGFAISAAVDFLDQMLDRGFGIDRIAQSMSFSFSIGPAFFVQIAKLRAFRMLWAKVVESFGGDRRNAKAILHARTALWNKTVYDPYVNLLRATTEAISAVLGGAESISVVAVAQCYREPDKSSRRLARNTQLILKHEAHLAQVADPTGGSYLIEMITNAIASKAWKLFQELESSGGFQRARDSGIIRSVLHHREQSRQNAANQRKLVLTGTNMFANPIEKALERVKSACTSEGTRVALGFEDLRLRAERKAIPLRFLLAEIGDAKMRSARSQFAAEFLACGGFSAEKQLFGSPAEIAAAETDVLVICGSDSEYLPIVKDLMSNLESRGKRHYVLIAGNPETKDQLAALGVAGFIHLGSDAVNVLFKLLQQFGIES